jgi:hypothetical protein
MDNKTYNGCIRSASEGLEYLPKSFINNPLFKMLPLGIELCYSIQILGDNELGITLYLNKGEQRTMTLREQRFQSTEIIGEIILIITKIVDDVGSAITWININPDYKGIGMRGIGLGSFLVLAALSYSNSYAPDIELIELDDDTDGTAAGITDPVQRDAKMKNNIYYKLGFQYADEGKSGAYGEEMIGNIKKILKMNMESFIINKSNTIKRSLDDVVEQGKRRRILSGGADIKNIMDIWSKDFIPVYEIIQFHKRNGYEEELADIIYQRHKYLNILLYDGVDDCLEELTNENMNYLRDNYTDIMNNMIKYLLEVKSEIKTVDIVRQYIQEVDSDSSNIPLYRRDVIEHYRLRGDAWLSEITRKVRSHIAGINEIINIRDIENAEGSDDEDVDIDEGWEERVEEEVLRAAEAAAGEEDNMNDETPPQETVQRRLEFGGGSKKKWTHRKKAKRNKMY